MALNSLPTEDGAEPGGNSVPNSGEDQSQVETVTQSGETENHTNNRKHTRRVHT